MADTKTDPEPDAATGDEQGAAGTQEMLADIRRDLAALASSLAAYGRGRSADLGQDLDRISEATVAEIGRLLGDLQRRIGKAETEIEKGVRAHPREWLGGLLAVLGIGFLVGILFGRRS